ncbi:infB, partial [Symbiodinium sp. CCMP2456]
QNGSNASFTGPGSRWMVLDPCQFGGVKSRHLFQGLGRVCHRFEEGDVLASLDYRKCFDFVHPDVVCDILQEAGLPAAIVKVLRFMWVQRRFLELSGYCSPEGEHIASSMPQGDGMSPLALNVLLSAACRAIRQDQAGPSSSSVFLDDRVFTARANEVAGILAQWAEWSAAFGLQENTRKQALVCRDPVARRFLCAQGQGQWLQESVRVLGADFTARRDNYHAVAEERVQSTIPRGNKLLTRGHFMDAGFMAGLNCIRALRASGWRMMTQDVSQPTWPMILRMLLRMRPRRPELIQMHPREPANKQMRISAVHHAIAGVIPACKWVASIVGGEEVVGKDGSKIDVEVNAEEGEMEQEMRLAEPLLWESEFPPEAEKKGMMKE